MMDKRFSVIAFFLSPLAASASKTFLSSTLGSNMVLQRDVSSSIYGWTTAPNVSVYCKIDGNTIENVSSFDSTPEGTFPWTCALPVYSGSFDEFVINVTAPATGQSAMLENVVFGDVFLCGGQSNMQFAMPGMLDSDTEIPDADNYPFIRVLSVGQDYNSPNDPWPQEDLYSVELPWSVGSSSVVSDGAADDYVAGFDIYSAVCYETGKQIYNTFLNGEIPVGLVSSNWGGTMIQTWMSEDAAKPCGGSELKRSEHFKEHPELKNQHVTEGDDTPDFSTTPAINFNNMIWPFRNMVIKSVVWYQAESNVGSDTDIYPCLQSNMIDEWRAMPGFTDVAMLYVQLAPWAAGGTTEIADMRWAQYAVLEDDDNSFMVTAADLGDPDSPYGDIHPRNKMEVARRLTLAAGTALYDMSAPYMGPVPLSGAALDDGSFGAYIKFDEDSLGEGLNLQDPQTCPDTTVCGYHYLVYPTAGNVLVGSMQIDEDTLYMYPETDQTEKPTGISYGYLDYPMMTIYNSYNTPLMPFEAPLPFEM